MMHSTLTAMDCMIITNWKQVLKKYQIINSSKNQMQYSPNSTYHGNLRGSPPMPPPKEIAGLIKGITTLPETNIAPENRPPQ